MQTKDVFGSSDLSSKVRAKIRSKVRGLLSDISSEQGTLFH